MTIEAYKNFVCIVDSGSINAAAKKLLIAQPSLSSQLKALEQAYGKQLIIRGARSIQLTDAGKIFYAKAKEICRLADSIQVDMQNETTMFHELLNLSMPAGNTACFLHKLFDHFIETHPHVNFDFYEVPNDFVVPNVLNDVTEIGFVRANVPHYQDLTVYPYQKEEIVAVVPPEHALAAGKTAATLQELAAYPLAVPFDCLDIVHSAFSARGLTPSIAVITSPRTTAVEWARSFGAVALISITPDDMALVEGMCWRPVDDAGMHLYSSFLTHKGRKLSQLALDFLAEHVNLNSEYGQDRL